MGIPRRGNSVCKASKGSEHMGRETDPSGWRVGSRTWETHNEGQRVQVHTGSLLEEGRRCVGVGEGQAD